MGSVSEMHHHPVDHGSQTETWPTQPNDAKPAARLGLNPAVYSTAQSTSHDLTSKKQRDNVRRPLFEELPLHVGDPKASAWGLFGDDDEIGTLNHLTTEVVRAAAREVCTGQVVPLNLPLDCPVLPMNPRRSACSHQFIAKGHANDDEICINTQGSSHWDGLRHYPYQCSNGPRYYNGGTQQDMGTGHESTGKIGVHNIAQRGIVGRGVLLDWRSWSKRKGIYRSPFETQSIPLHELLQVAQAQGVSFQPGDILLIRSGWTEEYNRLSRHEQIALAKREKRAFIGVEGSREMMKWHWDMQFSAVAGDTNAYEAWPPARPWGVACHEVFLSGWGMPIGELWDLEGLSQTCADRQRWSFLLTSCPLNLFGGAASPANVMATF